MWSTRLSEQLSAEQQRVHSMVEGLQSCEGAIQGLKEVTEGLKLGKDEREAELTFVQARQERADTGTPGSNVPPPGSLPVSGTEKTRHLYIYLLNAYAPAFLTSRM